MTGTGLLAATQSPPHPLSAEHLDHFYRDGSGACAIMSVAHFPDEILTFLQMECLAAFKTAVAEHCDAVVELGCFDGRALEVARAAGVPYCGVDINSGAVAALRERICDEGLEAQATTLVGDAQESVRWSTHVPGRRPLIVLPFNLLGNLPDPRRALLGLRALGGTVLISVFNEQPRTTAVRRAYYARCMTGLAEPAEGRYGGAVFRGAQGFRSESFSAPALHRLLRECGLEIRSETANRLGRSLTVGRA
ncbi:methyltransferase domain-containing protein [Streptomyces sp. MK5]|uniref:methyltransferase domain-containing protein n=1 Tax=Streptomyces sp. MK5 TaxID=3064253 RepID=UPI0027417C30|nr:methyltransferase domain-containing protein [Streptomyces sp. MK5]